MVRINSLLASTLALAQLAYAANNALLTSWMRQVPDNTLLTQLTIPGVYSVQSAQGLYTAFQQGARAVDARVTPYGLDFHLIQDESASDSMISLGKVFDKSVQFLQMHQTESIIIVLRSPDSITDELLIFLNRYRDFIVVDDWAQGVPMMEEMRGKIHLITQVEEMDEVAPFVDWKANTKATRGTMGNGTLYYVEDLQTLPLASYEDMVETKLEVITKNLRRAYMSQDVEELYLTYASLQGNSRFSSLDFMDGIWPAEGLLTKLSAFLDQAPISQSNRAGIVIMDWNNDPEVVTHKLLAPWLTADRPLRLQSISSA